jgi:hypothetical protein
MITITSFPALFLHVEVREPPRPSCVCSTQLENAIGTYTQNLFRAIMAAHTSAVSYIPTVPLPQQILVINAIKHLIESVKKSGGGNGGE